MGVPVKWGDVRPKQGADTVPPKRIKSLVAHRIFGTPMCTPLSPRRKATTMSIRKMTPEDKEKLFGGGLVLFGQKRPDSLKKESEQKPKPKQGKKSPKAPTGS
jgi:hypothetical protein